MLENAPGPTSHSFFSQRLRLHFVDWGNPTAPPLLLVHGGRDHCRNWDAVALELRDEWHVIAPDLRGHGDSEWSAEGNYGMNGYIYDMAQLIFQQNLSPVTIIAHSLGGNIALRYTGIYPESVRRLVAIEGLGSPPILKAKRSGRALEERMRIWVDEQREFSGRMPRRYKTVTEAIGRMQDENKHLSPEQARHLTIHGTNQNEDGTYSWKFDNYVRSWPPYDIPDEELYGLWARITCPTLLLYGTESWATNPRADGRSAHFNSVEIVAVEGAGHWVHHDQLSVFLSLTKEFIA